jgi:hypothetical protein
MVAAGGLEISAASVPVVDYDFAQVACARVLAELRRRHVPVDVGMVGGYHSQLE